MSWILTFLAAYVCVVVADVPEQYRKIHAQHVENLKDKTCDKDILHIGSVTSKLMCSWKCAQLETCFYFVYNKESKICQLHGKKLNVTTCSTTTSSGSRYYKLLNRKAYGEVCSASDECAGSHLECGIDNLCKCQGEMIYHPVNAVCERGLIGQNCTTTSECFVENSECGDGCCRCKAGYSFKPGKQLCPTDCSYYGTTFQRFEGRYISGYNDNSFADKTPSECQQLCVTHGPFICKACEHNLSNNQCYLHQYDVSTIPSSYKTTTGVDYYQRNCE